MRTLLAIKMIAMKPRPMAKSSKGAHPGADVDSPVVGVGGSGGTVGVLVGWAVGVGETALAVGVAVPAKAGLVGVGVGCTGVGVGDGVGVCVGVLVGAGGAGVGNRMGVTGTPVGVGGMVAVGVGVPVGGSVAVGNGVNVGGGVLVGVAVLVAVGRGVAVLVGVLAAVGVGRGVGSPCANDGAAPLVARKKSSSEIPAGQNRALRTWCQAILVIALPSAHGQFAVISEHTRHTQGRTSLPMAVLNSAGRDQQSKVA